MPTAAIRTAPAPSAPVQATQATSPEDDPFPWNDQADGDSTDEEDGEPSATTYAPQVPPVAEGHVLGVIVFCQGDIAKNGSPEPWRSHELPADDPAFSLAPSPTSAKLGLPLVVRRLGSRYPQRHLLDCQIATYLMVSPRTGFAPPEWQSHVGTVVVARKDRKPLTREHFEAFWMYNDSFLDNMPDVDGEEFFTRKEFEAWWKRYVWSHIQHRSENDFRRRPGSPFLL